MRVTERKFEKVFWTVWCPDRGKSIVRHETKAEAIAEAERLSEKEHAMFYVLEPVYAISKRVVKETTISFFSHTEHPPEKGPNYFQDVGDTGVKLESPSEIEKPPIGVTIYRGK